MNKIFGFLLILFLLSPALTKATTIATKTEVGPTGSDVTVTGTGDFIEGSREKRIDGWFWILEGEAGDSLTTVSPGVTVEDRTYTTDASIGFEGVSGIGVGGNFAYSNTPQENLKSSGPTLSLSYDWQYDQKDDFNPNLKVKLSGKYQSYIQSFSGTITNKKGKALPTAGINPLRQIGAESSISFSPSKLFTFQIIYNYYFYDRDVAKFISYLNSSFAISSGAGGFSSSISSFSLNTTSFDWIIYPFDKWYVDFEGIYSVAAYDLSIGLTGQAIVYYRLEDWKFGLGYEHISSELLTTSYAILEVDFDF